MPELLEKGYIYTAQPPLYKLKKGKQEVYVRDDDELREQLIAEVLDETQLVINKKGESISGQALGKLISQHKKVTNAITTLAQQYPEELIESMMYVDKLEDLKNPKKSKDWCKQLENRLNKSTKQGSTWKIEAEKVGDKKTLEPIAILHKHGTRNSWILGPNLFRSKSYKEICSFGDSLSSLLTKNSYFELNNLKLSTDNFSNSVNELIEAAKRSFTISRYKGLGEMNADQLWDTTMDPESRLLGQVSIEDAQKANDLFNDLMGDDVEPRKIFIDKHAKFVVNLDI